MLLARCEEYKIVVESALQALGIIADLSKHKVNYNAKLKCFGSNVMHLVDAPGNEIVATI
jgi:hypothetical protein